MMTTCLYIAAYVGVSEPADPSKRKVLSPFFVEVFALSTKAGSIN